jgi:CheY-like chemotaxis protein
MLAIDILLCDLNIERESDGYEVIRAMQKINPIGGLPGRNAPQCV